MSSIKQVSVEQEDHSYLSEPIGVDADQVDIDENHTLADKAPVWDNKVDKVQGKGLSTNDFTNNDKLKLNNLSNYDDTSINGRVSDIENIIPSNATTDNKLATIADIGNVGTGNGKDITRFVGTHEDWEALSLEEQEPVTDIIYTDDNGGGGGSGGGSSSSSTYKLPTASTTRLGGIKVGKNLTIDPDGTLNAQAGSGSSESTYTLPKASSSTLGGIKVGTGLSVKSDGTLSVDKVQIDEIDADKVNIDSSHTLEDKITDWDNKVDKVTGKDLSSNDFTDDYKEKIDGLSNYDDTALSGRVTNLEDLVPENASSSNKLATLADIPAGGSGTGTGGTTNYPNLTNKPKIAGVELVGDKSLADLGVQPAEEGKGLSSNDFTNEYKTKLDNLDENAKDNVIESISVNGIAQTITNKDVDITVPEPVTELNADKVNIDETHTLADKSTDWDNKVDKVSGKGLSTEDYTTEEKNKLAGLSNYDDTALDNRIDNIEELIPTTASEDNKLATIADIPSGIGGTTNYESLENKPSIAGVTLSGNKTLSDLGIQPAEEGKGLSVENYTTEEKTKLAGLSNYDDTTLAGRVTNIEDIIPSTATTENKLATLADIPEGGSSVPEGGTTGQVLTKKSNTDGDVEWKDLPTFTAADIDRIWGSSLEDGDNGRY